MSVTIYHNPKCSKSRQTLDLIKGKGIDPQIITYLDTPPTAAELKDILSKLGKTAAQIVRNKEAKEEGIDVANLDNDALIQALVANPRAMERPIVVNGDKAAMGRPPESVLDII